MSQTNKPKLAPTPEPEEELSIAKPAGFDINKFKARGVSMANVETLQTALPVHKISAAKDYVRLHPDEDEYWSPGPLCFVNIKIKGQDRDTLHLIYEELAREYVAAALVTQYRLALATKPYDTFFLCLIPVTNLDNSWNMSNVSACQHAKDYWVMATSRKAEGAECYKIDRARNEDAFPEPKWPSQSLEQLIAVTFNGRMIDRADHPGLLRLVGGKQSMS